ncbi:unnamed protein product [Arctogadus glacialis]
MTSKRYKTGCLNGDEQVPLSQKKLVCDFSLALLGGVVKAFTLQPDLKTYIDQCFGCLCSAFCDSNSFSRAEQELSWTLRGLLQEIVCSLGAM